MRRKSTVPLLMILFVLIRGIRHRPFSGIGPDPAADQDRVSVEHRLAAVCGQGPEAL